MGPKRVRFLQSDPIHEGNFGGSRDSFGRRNWPRKLQNINHSIFGKFFGVYYRASPLQLLNIGKGENLGNKTISWQSYRDSDKS